MMNKSRYHKKSTTAGAFTDFKDQQLRNTMMNFLHEEKEQEPSIWNVATIAGIAMFLVCMFYTLQLLGLITVNFSGLIQSLPAIGAVLIGFIGFGFFVGDRKRVKKTLKRHKKERQEYFEKEFPSDQFSSNEEVDLEEELFGAASDADTAHATQSGIYDDYALHQSKKLYKSRVDKKITGVCGGLARYFGISSTVVRVLFLITFFASSGTTFIAYIALAIALDKEPEKISEGYDF